MLEVYTAGPSRSFARGFRSAARWGLLLGVALANAAKARAESPVVILPDTLSASPNAPDFGYIWRRGSRVVVAGILPILGASPTAPWGFRVAPFVELYNTAGSLSLVSNEDWRGRVSMEFWRTWLRGASPEEAPWLRLGLGFDHESDHATVRREVPIPPYSFLQLNDIGFRATASTSSTGPIIASGELDSVLLVASCTQPNVDCLQHWDTDFGGSLELVLQRPLHWGQSWRAFWSFSFSWVLPTGRVLGEARLVSHLGLWHRSIGGAWQLFILGYFGNDVGVNREKSVYQWGAGLRWNP